MNLKIKTGTVGYNNKILVSDGKFNLGKMMRLINTLEPIKHTFTPKAAIKSHKVVEQSTITQASLLQNQLSLT